MLACPLCGAQNNDFAVVCCNCKGWLQSKVNALDLFSTVWGLIENPSFTFRQIARARHKNYSLLLASLFGISLMFGLFRLWHVGDNVSEFHLIFVAAIAPGPLVGFVWIAAVTWMTSLISKPRGERAAFRDAFAAISYATVPLIFLLWAVLPVELAIFGKDLFGTNPSPAVIKPGIFRALLGLNAAGLVWFLFLLGQSISAVHGLRQAYAYAGSLIIFLATVGVGIVVGKG
jgi:hypothetical protein